MARPPLRQAAEHIPPRVLPPTCRADERSHGTLEAVPDCAGPPLGIGLADTYSQATIRLHHGDLLVLFTDGLVEERGRRHGAFGVTRLDTAIRDRAANGAGAVKDKVMGSWQKFFAGKTCEDDVTHVVLGRARSIMLPSD
jgi:hypothetical protein